MECGKTKLKVQNHGSKLKIKQDSLINLFLILLGIYFIFITVRALKDSHFFTKRDRVTAIFYGKRPAFVSLGLSDGVNYVGYFTTEAEVIVPGGYGRYKIGALGRLADLENNPEIMRKTFSSVISAHVDFFFYPRNSPIFSDLGEKGEEDLSLPKLSILDVFFNRRFVTNANLIDRWLIFVRMLNKQRNDFSLITTGSIRQLENQTIFREDRFDKKYQGFFYEKTLRDEGKRVKILYSSYSAAKILSRILDGEGIAVSDLSIIDKPYKECIIRESGSDASKTAVFLISIFDCRRQTGVADDVDIIFIPGEKIEREWE